MCKYIIPRKEKAKKKNRSKGELHSLPATDGNHDCLGRIRAAFKHCRHNRFKAARNPYNINMERKQVDVEKNGHNNRLLNIIYLFVVPKDASVDKSSGLFIPKTILLYPQENAPSKVLISE